MGEGGFQNDDGVTKIYEHGPMKRGPMKRARANNSVKWDRGWWHKYTKQASLRSPVKIVNEDSDYSRGTRVPQFPLGC